MSTGIREGKMTKDEATIVIMKNALRECTSTIEFLHNCLTDPLYYKHEYPGGTVFRIKKLKELVGEEVMCVHSMTVEGCPGCEDRIKGWDERLEAEKVLAE